MILLFFQIEIKKVRWKDKNSKSINLPDGFLSIESCTLGPLTILDRWYVCASNFDSLVYTIKERRRRRRRRRKKERNS
jgi:hypothetical protein